ncbi:M3 family oligoendopeptidase [Lacticaseibacillus saniviri]
MDFTQVPYERPDYLAFKQRLTDLEIQLGNASSADEALAVADKAVTYLNHVDTQAMIASIRHTIDTTDQFYQAEDDYWNEYGPQFEDATAPYLKQLLASPYQEVLTAVYPKTFMMKAKNRLRLQDSAIIADQQRDNQLISEYSNLIASAQIPFDGQVYTLAQLGPLRQSQDRVVRKAANEAYWQFFSDHEADFDRIYDEMVKVRTKMAQTLGFDDFAQMSYVMMDRFDYDETVVTKYRQAVLEQVVPVVLHQREKQAKRLGLDQLAYYDLDVQFKSGNAVPQGSPEELVAKANQMYHELSPETGSFFDFMVDSNLLDLVAKKGKASGGYAEFLPEIQAPFIFANFNGTSGDVDVLTHEAGHAFQTYQAKWIKPGDTVFPTFEAAEIFSMSMEFITYPWMTLFFGQETEKYKYAHLQDAVEFLPYGILVDHFQHEIYTHPEWTPSERKQAWRELERQYTPDRDYSENAALDSGIFWFRQGHIFESPFYYIDYTIAQVVAYQFWKRFNVDHDEQAWPDYMAMAKAGGSQTLLQLIQTGHLASPFEPSTLADTLKPIQAALDAVDDQAL